MDADAFVIQETIIKQLEEMQAVHAINGMVNYEFIWAEAQEQAIDIVRTAFNEE